MNILLLYVVTVFIVLNIAFASQNIDFKCLKVSSSICASSYQYLVQGKFQNKQLNFRYCAENAVQCENKAISESFNVQSCKIDYKAKTCTPQICYMKPDVQICEKNFDSCTANKINSFFSCLDCGKITSCKKCLNNVTNTTNTANTTTQTCLGESCTEGLSNTTAIYQQCNNGYDILGQKCKCCIKTKQISRFCIQNNNVLSKSQVVNWIKSALGFGGFRIQVFGLLIFLTILGLFY